MSRRGPLAAFFAFGLLWGGWAALVPAVQDAVGASKGALGLAFLFVAVGSLPAMLFTGRELDRRGHGIVPLALCGLAVAALLPAFAGSTVGSLQHCSGWASAPAPSTWRSTEPSPTSKRAAACT